MKRVLLVGVLLVVSGSLAWGQANQVQFQPIVDFTGIFQDLLKMFGKILSEYWGLILSVFFAWFMLESIRSFMDGKYERLRLEKERELRIEKQVIAAEDKRAVARLTRQRELERSYESSGFESEYRSRELQRIVSDEGMYFAIIEGDYKGSESFKIISYRAPDPDDDTPLYYEEFDPFVTDKVEFRSVV
jgi:hypothetical protein